MTSQQPYRMGKPRCQEAKSLARVAGSIHCSPGVTDPSPGLRGCWIAQGLLGRGTPPAFPSKMGSSLGWSREMDLNSKSRCPLQQMT